MPPSDSLPAAAAAARVARRGLRILYADDLRELRELFRAVLGREGHDVFAVHDGQLALELICAQPAAYDLLVTDHHMPRLNGLDLVARVRGTPFAGKIMVFSSELSPQVHARYQCYAVDRIVLKPVLPATLRQTLAEMFPPAPG